MHAGNTIVVSAAVSEVRHCRRTAAADPDQAPVASTPSTTVDPSSLPSVVVVAAVEDTSAAELAGETDKASAVVVALWLHCGHWDSEVVLRAR